MLNSIREIFDIAGVPLESMKFVDEKFESERSIIDAILYQKKCPAIVGAKFDISNPANHVCVHVMVADGVQLGWPSIIQCKNSYRDQNEPGKVHHKL